MRIRKVRLSGFQCYGPEVTEIDLTDLTVLIGANGCGKTAILEALCRVFGASPSQRTLTWKDFHVPHGQTLEELGKAKLRIEVEIFPGIGDDAASKRERALTFAQMVIANPGEAPYARAVLDANWEVGSGPEGFIESQLYWALTPEQEIPDDKRFKMKAADQAQIQVYYVPAIREPSRQLKYVSGSLLYRIFRATEWSQKTQQHVKDAAEEAAKIFKDEMAVKLFHDKLEGNWKILHPAKPFGTPFLRFTGKDIEQIIRQAVMWFETGPSGSSVEVDQLSDGQRSLFYLSIIGAVCDLENEVMNSTPFDGTDPEPKSAAARFNSKRLKIPALTLFAIEEPENHLSLRTIWGALQRCLEGFRQGNCHRFYSPHILRL